MTVLASLMAVLLLVSGGAYLYVSRMFDPNTEGGGGQLTRPETVTPPELAESQVNFLVPVSYTHLKAAGREYRGAERPE